MTEDDTIAKAIRNAMRNGMFVQLVNLHKDEKEYYAFMKSKRKRVQKNKKRY